MALDISCCDRSVTDSAFHRPATESDLKVLRMGNLTRIAVLGIGAILQCCKVLEYIDSRSLPHVTEAGCEQSWVELSSLLQGKFHQQLTGVQSDG